MENDFQAQTGDINVNTLLSFIAEGMVMFDGKGNITTLNPHASLLLDYTTNELIGKNLDDIILVYSGDKLLPSKDKIAAMALSGDIFTVPRGETYYFESQSKRRFPVFASAKPISFCQGTDEVNGGVLVFRDITVEKELEQYKENTAKTLSQLTPILQKTATGDFDSYPDLPHEENEFTELLVGLRLMLDDLKELDTARERNEKDKIAALEEKRLLSEKYSKELEEEVEEKTKELIGANQHIETVIENLTQGLIEYDHDNKVVRLNRAAEKMLGIKKEDIIGRRVNKSDIDSPQRKSLSIVTYPILSETTKNVSREVSGIDADVCEVTVSYPVERELQITELVVHVHSSEQRGTLKIIRDVTREKLISRSKSEFISIAAHQLRTPLSALKWALNLLIKGDFGALNPAQTKVMNESFDTNEKMIGLVNDLLNVARIEDGRFGYEFAKTDFHEMVSRTISTSTFRAKEKGLEMVYNDQLLTQTELMIDRSKLSIVLQNLIDNAIKYTSSGGRIEVTTSRSKNFVRVEVKDTGLGIPKHQLDRLFTKFFRAENVVRLPFSGSGLGLFIARNIVVRHGGEITVESTEGQGTTFAFTVPTDESLIPAKDEVAASLYA